MIPLTVRTVLPIRFTVINYETNNVVVLSSEGENCRQILTKSDGLDKPYSLRINIDRSELLVCNENGLAFLFSLH